MTDEFRVENIQKTPDSGKKTGTILFHSNTSYHIQALDYNFCNNYRWFNFIDRRAGQIDTIYLPTINLSNYLFISLFISILKSSIIVYDYIKISLNKSS